MSLLAAAAAAVGGLAFAYWIADGQGAGAAATDAVAVVTLSPATSAGGLYPGGWAPVDLTITNPNSSAVHIGSLALDTGAADLGFAVDADHPGCSPSALAFVTATNGGAGWTVAGASGDDDGSQPATLPDSLTMSLDAADACQGAEFTVYLTAGP